MLVSKVMKDPGDLAVRRGIRVQMVEMDKKEVLEEMDIQALLDYLELKELTDPQGKQEVQVNCRLESVY